MRSRDDLAQWARAKLASALTDSPHLVSSDGVLMVTGSIGYCGYVSATGDVFLEEDTFDPEPGSFRVNRGELAQVRVLVLASRRYPELSQWLPDRDSGDPDCDLCAGSGWHRVGTHSVLCERCAGLGWVRLREGAG